MTPAVFIHHAAANRWLHFKNPIHVLAAYRIDDVLPCLQKIEQLVNKQGLYAAGFISYEAAPAFDSSLKTHPACDFPILWFGIYDVPKALQELPKQIHSYQLKAWTCSINRKDYEKAIQQIKNYIASGNTYQVNYTFRLRAAFNGEPWGLFLSMQSAQPTSYAAYIDIGSHVICSASPELFFQRNNSQLICRPMKGTAARGKTKAEDKQQAEWLHSSEKNRAENVMIVDMIRNDLGRVAETGSVKVTKHFEIEKYPTIWQMTSTVTAKSQANLRKLLCALFPCASITGAPKISTMSIIANLEDTPRHIYTGCIGFITPQNDIQFSVAIRTAIIDRKTRIAEYGVGSGIVWDSNTHAEYDECLMKAKFLTTTSEKKYRFSENHRSKRPTTAISKEPKCQSFSLIESLLWSPQEGYFLLDYHFKRLSASAKYFTFHLNLSHVERTLHKLVKSLPPEAHKIRLLLHSNGDFDCQATPLAALQKPNPARVCLAPQAIDSENLFIYHKTTQRQVYEIAQAACPNCDEVLLWNERDELTEAGTANIVVELDGELLTPPISCGLLAGTFRAWLLEREEIQEKIIPRQIIEKCNQIYLINSVRKWRKALL